ncbi:hypothetical protein IWX49DRAFT_621702 [Phyllosticta citricarpa]|uniref:Uncharacterized protein n=2 Tax=Phyllosticta TaxID=121621 RepID=A0ABR1LIN7_9PEZI
MSSNGNPPPNGRDQASNNGSSNDTNNTNDTSSNGQARGPYVPYRPTPRVPTSGRLTAEERNQYYDFQFPRESFYHVDPANSSADDAPSRRQRPVSEQTGLSGSSRVGSPFDSSARSLVSPATSGGSGEGGAEQGAARRQSYSFGALYRERAANASAEEDRQRREEIRARAGAIVDAAMAGRTTLDSGIGGEQARQREDEERRRRQDAHLNGVGAWAEDEDAGDRE